MHKQLRELERRFQPGYRLVDVATLAAHVEGPDGQRVTVDGRILQVAVSDGSAHRLRRAESLLRQAGVIAPVQHNATNPSTPRRRRKAQEHHAPRPILNQPKSALLLAAETLRDGQATPRERRLARELQNAAEQSGRMRELARELGRRLRAAEAALDRHAAA